MSNEDTPKEIDLMRINPSRSMKVLRAIGQGVAWPFRLGLRGANVVVLLTTGLIVILGVAVGHVAAWPLALMLIMGLIFLFTLVVIWLAARRSWHSSHQDKGDGKDPPALVVGENPGTPDPDEDPPPRSGR